MLKEINTTKLIRGYKMKKLILTILVVAAMLLSADVSYGFGDIDASSKQQQDQKQRQKQDQKQNQKQGQSQDASNTQSQVNEGNTTEVSIDNSTVIPAPIMPVPGFINPSAKTAYDESWTTSPFDIGKIDFTIGELRRVANPSRFLLIGWCEWDKSFQIEIACWAKAKPQKAVQIYPAGTAVVGFTKIGEAQAKAVELHKSERQVAAALCIYAAKQGAKVVVLHTFSNPVTKADSAVLGGAGASVTATGDIVNSAGGFGWTTAEKVYRSYVVAELYR